MKKKKKKSQNHNKKMMTQKTHFLDFSSLEPQPKTLNNRADFPSIRIVALHGISLLILNLWMKWDLGLLLMICSRRKLNKLGLRISIGVH